MTAAAADSPADDERTPGPLPAGRVGRAHGLDGSFYVTQPRSRLLALGARVAVAGAGHAITRRAGSDIRPIVRLEGIESREAAGALRGLELTVELAEAVALEEGEWWASELEGCQVVDGERLIGIVVGLLELPSCEALEVRRATSGKGPAHSVEELLVPMVHDAIRAVDLDRGRIDVNMGFLEEDS